MRDISTLEQAYQLVQDLDRFQGSLSLDAHTIGLTPTSPPLLNSSLVSPSLSPVLDLVSPLRSMMIKAKEFTVSHLDRFNRINALSVKIWSNCCTMPERDKNFDY